METNSSETTNNIDQKVLSNRKAFTHEYWYVILALNSQQPRHSLSNTNNNKSGCLQFGHLARRVFWVIFGQPRTQGLLEAAVSNNAQKTLGERLLLMHKLM